MTAPALSDARLASLESVATQYARGETPDRMLTMHEVSALAAETCRLRKQGENWFVWMAERDDAGVCRGWLEAVDDYCRERGYY